jgi:hypothetical protein
MGRANGEEDKNNTHHELTLGIFYGIFGCIVFYTAARLLYIYLKHRAKKAPTKTHYPTPRKLIEEGVKPARSKSYILEMEGEEDVMSMSEPTMVGCKLKEISPKTEKKLRSKDKHKRMRQEVMV